MLRFTIILSMGMMRLKPDLHKKLKHIAADAESTVSKLVHEKMEQFIDAVEKASMPQNPKKAAKK